MTDSMAILLSMFAFVLVAILGILNADIPASRLGMCALVGLGVFYFLGKIYASVGRDLFREAVSDAKNRRNMQNNLARDLLDDEAEFEMDLPGSDET